MSIAGRVAHTIAHPVQSLHQLAGDGPLAALLILFGLNAVDELDRTAFAILLPEIRDEFGLGFQGMLTLLALVIAAALALQVPIAGLADRYNRVHLASAGAFVWAIMSFSTGLATTVVFLGIVRSGSAIGKAVIDPTHNSLLADWFPPERRPAVYSFHRSANALGAAIGPLLAGFLAYWWGWRVPFFVF
ncbi:MAG: MFS transporter, partial [Acidimicrobiia bacterium]|nr:MFS transporter [Acidimicrobiia bacterium]